MDKLFVYTDGGARGNPGPSAIGVFIQDEKGNEIVSLSEKIGVATNNIAEYKAVGRALDWLVENKNKFLNLKKIYFYLDSLLICSQINGVYKVKNSNLRNELFEIRKKEAVINLPIIYNHILRHKNEKADLLVNKALDNSL